jgi:hypothetical protein
MTTPYIPILDAEIDPDAPIKSDIAYRLRDNLIAVTEGDPAAPSINPAIISQAGAGTDGHLNNGTTISGLGFFDFDLMSISTNKTIPCATVLRINGNASLSAVLTVQRRRQSPDSFSSTPSQVSAELAQLAAMGIIIPTPGSFLSTSGYGGSNGGGGGIAGGTPSPALKIDLTGMIRPWTSRYPVIGGVGGLSGSGSGTFFGEAGGVTVIIVEGDFDMTGGTIDADSNDVDNTGAGGNTPGSGSGGTIIVIVTGTLTNGTFHARSGAGLNGNYVGGGGRVYLVASAVVGTQTIDVTHSGSGTTTNAGNGTSSTDILTRDQIRTLISRWI